jgi:uncharacterized protein YceK
MRTVFAALVVALFSAGCASVPMAGKDRDAAAKVFATTPDAATLYVYRASSWGTSVKYPVHVDGRFIGELPGSTFLFLPVQPGPHTVMVLAESSKTQPFTAEAGKLYYVKVTPAMGWLSANANLYLMADENEAQTDVRGCDLIQVQ